MFQSSLYDQGVEVVAVTLPGMDWSPDVNYILFMSIGICGKGQTR